MRDIWQACMYCSKPLDGKWFSEFSSETHYKCIICSCGRENCRYVDFIGTGHDNMSLLEQKIGKSSIKVVEKTVTILR
jgi:hypothetical protein